MSAIANVIGNLEELDQAVALLEQVLAAAETIDDSDHEVYALSAIAQAYGNLEKPDEAVALLKQAVAAAETIDYSDSKAYALRAIAEAYGQLEQWRLALKVTRKCRGNEDCRVGSLEAVLMIHAEKYVTGSQMQEGE